MYILKSGDFLKQGCQKTQYLYKFLLIFSLNKFLKFILCKKIMLIVWFNVEVKKYKSRVARFLTFYVILIFGIFCIRFLCLIFLTILAFVKMAVLTEFY